MKVLLAVLLLIPVQLSAQTNNWHYSIEAQALAAPAGKLPFWFRAGQFGSIPLAGTSASFIASVDKDYDTTSNKAVYWGVGLQTRVNAGSATYLSLIEGYVKLKKGIFELKGGRAKNIVGIVDTTLSSGSFAVSGNALGIPQINLSIPNYYVLPFLNNFFAFKGTLSYGWVGNVAVSSEKAPAVKNDNLNYLQNSLYLRLGRPESKLKLFGGVNHNVMYGNERRNLLFDISPSATFIYAATGKTYAGLSKIGNHLGSIDMAMQYDLNNMQVVVYRQNLYDVGAIGHLANIADGINGISLVNKKPLAGSSRWNKVLIEFIYTKNQAGAYGEKVKSGDEDYYNNYEYTEGWVYKGINIGNPLLTSRKFTRAGLVTDPNDNIIDNRILALHAGFEATFKQISWLAKLTCSKNYGTYGTNYPGHSTSGKYGGVKYGIFKEVNELSGYLEANKKLNGGIDIGVALAADNGGLYYNSTGLLVKLRKTFY